jgi:hypothetical protein
MFLDFPASSISLNKIFLIMDILLILSTMFIYFIVFKEYKKLFDISAKNYIINTISEAMIKLPIKWFDWLKFVIIIGTLSALNIIYNDKYILLIIYISYVAMFFDLYYFIYDFTSIAIQKPAADCLNKNITNLEVLFVNLIKYSIYDINPEEKCKEKNIDEIKCYIKNSILEDLAQYKPTSALTEKDVLNRKLINKLDEMIRTIEYLKKCKIYFTLSLKGAMAILAFILTSDFYLFIRNTPQLCCWDKVHTCPT